MKRKKKKYKNEKWKIEMWDKTADATGKNQKVQEPLTCVYMFIFLLLLTLSQGRKICLENSQTYIFYKSKKINSMKKKKNKQTLYLKIKFPINKIYIQTCNYD